MKDYQDVYQTAGAFSWTELTTPDPKAAAAFYGALFGWKFDVMNMGQGDYQVVKAGDTAVGGIMGTPPNMPAGVPPCWSAYVTVANTDAAVEKCKALGGKLITGPMDIPTVGRFAVLQDPQGAIFNVIAYSGPG